MVTMKREEKTQGNTYSDDDDDDDEVAVFPTRNRLSSAVRLPTLTQKGRLLPKHIREGHYQSQPIIASMGPGQQLEDEGYLSTIRHASRTYAQVNSPSPMQTAGGRPIYINSFVSSTQRKRLEQLEKLEKAETDLLQVLADSEDLKVRAKLLHIQALKRRLQENERETLSSGETKLCYEIGKITERRRVANESREFLRQAEALAGGFGGYPVSYGEKSAKKRGYDHQATSYAAYASSELNTSFGSSSSSSPISTWDTAINPPSSRSSYSPSYHPTTGGKTISQDTFQKQKRQKSINVEDLIVADDDLGESSEEDTGGRRTYSGKSLPGNTLLHVATYDVGEVLKEDEHLEEDKQEEKEQEGSSDGSSDGETDSDTDTGDEREKDSRV